MKRDFRSLYTMFRHITLYHQNAADFQITCNLHSTCGVLYRTYSAYKSHIYRRHAAELNSREYDKRNETFLTDYVRRDNADIDTQSTDSDNSHTFDFVDCDSDPMPSNANAPFLSTNNYHENTYSIEDIKKSFLLFILQLREEFLLPKYVMNIITTYITSLIHQIENLLEKKTFINLANDPLSVSSSFRNEEKKVIYFAELKYLFDDTCNAIQCITKNEYQLIKHCEEYFNYRPVEEIALSSPSEAQEFGYYIPIEQSLLSILNCRSFANRILENIHQQQVARDLDNDLMFSIRHGCYGLGIDDDHLLIQLYIDDISLTNPLGAKRDKQKFSMIYFMIEDIPDENRSKLDSIQLVGLCNSKILKVKTLEDFE